MKKISRLSGSLIVINGLATITTLATISCGSNSNGLTDLQNQTLTYKATVVHMDKITQNEASQIQSSIYAFIVNRMNEFNAEQEIDYTITGVNQIIKDVDLREVIVSVLGTDSSTNVTGSTDIVFEITENINTWTLSSPVTVASNESTSMSDFYVTQLKNQIQLKVGQTMTQVQQNQLNVDYVIDGLQLIQTGSNLDDFKDNIFVKALDSTPNVAGQFKVTFVVQ